MVTERDARGGGVDRGIGGTLGTVTTWFVPHGLAVVNRALID